LTTNGGRISGDDTDFERLIVDNVSRHYGRLRALWRVSLECGAGEILGLLGPNGAGKSTLLGILATLIAPSSGRVVYGARTAAEAGPALRQHIGVLGHESHLYPELTARENLEFFGRLYGLELAAGRAQQALATAGLGARADEPVARFSRGMRQRVALERALIHNPRLILLDEPFTGMDDASSSALVDRLKGLARNGALVVMATHDLDVAGALLDKAAIFKDGRLLSVEAGGTPWREVYRERINRL
jgi:heme exporter protein A